MKEKNIQELAIRMGLITVEDMCQYTVAQLVVKIANKVNELVNEVWRFETDVQDVLKTQNENIQYLLGEGLHLEVENIFDGWFKDGTFDTLLNQSALKKVNNRIDETNARLSLLDNHAKRMCVTLEMFGAIPYNAINPVSCTGAFEKAIHFLNDNGGGVILIDNVYYIGSPITIHNVVSPISIEGYSRSQATIDNNGTPVLNNSTIVCDNIKNLFNLNCYWDTDRCNYKSTTSQGFFTKFNCENLTFINRSKLAGTTIFNQYKTRATFKNIYAYGFDYVIVNIENALNYNNELKQNYCDLCVYENIQVSNSTKGIMILRYADSSRISGVSYEYPINASGDAIKIISSTDVEISNIVYNCGRDSEEEFTDSSFIKTDKCININIKNIHSENVRHSILVHFYFSKNCTLNGVSEKFFGHNLFNINNSSYITITNVDSNSTRKTGKYDLRFSGDKSNNFFNIFENYKFRNYESDVFRKPVISALSNCYLNTGQKYNIKVYSNDGSTWLVEDSNGYDLSTHFEVAFTNNVIRVTPKLMYNINNVQVTPLRVGVSIPYIFAIRSINPIEVNVIDYDGSILTSMNNRMGVILSIS